MSFMPRKVRHRFRAMFLLAVNYIVQGVAPIDAVGMMLGKVRLMMSERASSAAAISRCYARGWRKRLCLSLLQRRTPAHAVSQPL